MPETSTLIAVPLDDVWAALTTNDMWKAWYGVAPTVSPGWEPGATLVWPNGDRSTLEECVEGKTLTWGGMFFASTIGLVPQGDETEIHYSFEGRNGASFSDGGAAQLAKVEEKLALLKGLLEA